MPERFDKFSEHARSALTLAQQEAHRFNHNYIGTEHLLLGLLRMPDSVAVRVLTGLGLELNKARSAVEFIIGRGDRDVPGEIGLTPRAKKVIELAVQEARRLNHSYIGSEHLLLGLLQEGDGIAAGVLESLGVSLARARERVLKELGQSIPPNPGSRDFVQRPSSSTSFMVYLTDAESKQVADLVEAGLGRDEVAVVTWLLLAGLRAQAELVGRATEVAGQIRNLRNEMQQLAERVLAPRESQAVAHDQPEQGAREPEGSIDQPSDQ